MKPWRKRVLAAAIGVSLATCSIPIFGLTLVLVMAYAEKTQTHAGVGHVWVPHPSRLGSGSYVALGYARNPT